MVEKNSKVMRTVKKSKGTENTSIEEHKDSAPAKEKKLLLKKDKKITVLEKSTSANKEEQVSDNKEEQVSEYNLVEGVELRFGSQCVALKKEVGFMSEKLKEMKLFLKKLESAYKHDVKKVAKSKRKRKGNTIPTGFIKTTPVPAKLANFLDIDAGTELSGPEVTSLVWKALEAKGLQYKEDRRVFRTNTEVTDVFGVDKSVNKSILHNDKKGFNFCNIQKYISTALQGN
jgi:hypothetical protein